jgi:hypothetical protein
MKQQGLSLWLPTVAFIVGMTFCSMVAAPAWSQTTNEDTRQGTPSGVGMQLAAFGASIPYFVGKGAFAIGGGIIGGLAYVFSGFNEQTAKSIWIPSMYGTYVITPEHLTGERPVRFLGVAAESEGVAAPSAPMNNPAP